MDRKELLIFVGVLPRYLGLEKSLRRVVDEMSSIVMDPGTAYAERFMALATIEEVLSPHYSAKDGLYGEPVEDDQ